MNEEYENPSKIRNLVAAGIIAVPLVLGGKAAARGICEKEVKPDDSQKTEVVVPQMEQKLPRFKWVGDVEPIYDAWATGNTLTSSVPKICGPSKIEEEKSFNDVYFNIKNPNEICFNQVEFRGANKFELEGILANFERNNIFSKRNFFEEEYSNRNIIAKVGAKGEVLEAFNKAIKDGSLTDEELAKLPNGFYGFYYLARNNDDCKNIIESLPGLIYIAYKPVEKVEKPVEALEKEVSKELVHRFGLGLDWHINELLVPHFRYMIGIPVDLGRIFPGLEVGFSGTRIEQPDQVTTTPEDPITGFYGHGVTKENHNQTLFEVLGSFGYTPDTAKPLYLGSVTGFSYFNNLINTDEEEQIFNRAGREVAKNKDSYTTEISRLRWKLLAEVGLNTFSEDKKLEIGGSGRGGFVLDFVDPTDSKAVVGGEFYLKY